MSMRSSAARVLVVVVLALVAIACLTSTVFAGVLALVTIAGVVLDTIRVDLRKRTAPRTSEPRTLVVDLRRRT